MLSYEDFKDEILDQILDYLPRKYSDCDVKFEQVMKNNGMVNDGLVIRAKDKNITPTIYVREFYEDLANGVPFETICQQIADIRLHADTNDDIEISQVLDFEYVKNQIYCSLINKERNCDYLKGRPHREYMDLAIIYYIDITELGIKIPASGRMNLVITNEILESYQISEEELYECASANMVKIPPVCKFLHELMIDNIAERLEAGYMSDEEVHEIASKVFTGRNFDVMFLTNESKCRGSSLILNPEIMRDIADSFESDFYIIPSSIHEVLLISVNSCITKEAMLNMVREVNFNTIGEEDFLSDNIYFYDSDEEETFLVVS